MPIQRVTCSLVDFMLLDLSQFDYLYGGQDCTHYGIGELSTAETDDKNDDGTQPFWTVRLVQDRLYRELAWTITSFDALLGMIGGFVGLVWTVIIWSIGGYEEFRFLQEVISEIYSTTESSRMMVDREP